jgi:hypothetical protein
MGGVMSETRKSQKPEFLPLLVEVKVNGIDVMMVPGGCIIRGAFVPNVALGRTVAMGPIRLVPCRDWGGTGEPVWFVEAMTERLKQVFQFPEADGPEDVA